MFSNVYRAQPPEEKLTLHNWEKWYPLFSSFGAACGFQTILRGEEDMPLDSNSPEFSWYIQRRANAWNALESYIDDSVKDLYFLDTSDIALLWDHLYSSMNEEGMRRQLELKKEIQQNLLQDLDISGWIGRHNGLFR